MCGRKLGITDDQHVGIGDMYLEGLDENGNEVIFTASGQPHRTDELLPWNRTAQTAGSPHTCRNGADG